MASIEVGLWSALLHKAPKHVEFLSSPLLVQRILSSSKTFCTIRRQKAHLADLGLPWWCMQEGSNGRTFLRKVRHMALRPRPMRKSLHLCKEQVIKAAMDLGEPKRRHLHVAVNLRFTVSSEQPAQNSHPPHPRYLRAFEHWQYPFAYLGGRRVRITIVHLGY